MTRAGGCSSGLFPKIRRPVRLPRFPSVGRPVRGQGDDGAGQSLRGKGSFAFVSLSRQNRSARRFLAQRFVSRRRFPARGPLTQVSRFPREPARRRLCLFRALFRRAEARRNGDRAGTAALRRKVALCVCRALPELFVFFVRRFARRRSSARTCAFVRGAGAEGRFSESAASCGVCAFSRAAGGSAYSKPRLRR